MSAQRVTERFDPAALYRAAMATSWSDLARRLDVTPVALRRATLAGGWSAHRADAHAVRLGFHPIEVWDEWARP